LYGELLSTDVTVTCLCPSRTKSNFAKIANSPFQHDDTRPSDTPENAAKAGINAFLKGKQTTISGKQKFTVSVLPRFLSRSRVVKIASSQYKTTENS
jgi:short-subunit dehydrogenase